MIFEKLVLKTALGAGHWWLTPVNPSYSGGRNQEDRGSKSVLGK
jgi:hypothetical protein